MNKEVRAQQKKNPNQIKNKNNKYQNKKQTIYTTYSYLLIIKALHIHISHKYILFQKILSIKDKRDNKLDYCQTDLHRS